MSDKTNINEDHNAHHVYIDFYTITEGLLAASRYFSMIPKFEF